MCTTSLALKARKVVPANSFQPTMKIRKHLKNHNRKKYNNESRIVHKLVWLWGVKVCVGYAMKTRRKMSNRKRK